MNTDKLKVGQKIYYTGDMANGDSFGEIIKVETISIYPVTYTIKYEEERFEGDTKISKCILPSSFEKSPGQRFKTIEQYEEERTEKLERYKDYIGNRSKVL